MTNATEHAVLQLAVLVGSLRAQSFSRKIAKALAARAPDSVRCRFIEIGDLPLYNEDLDGDDPVRRCANATRCCSSPRNTTARSPAA